MGKNVLDFEGKSIVWIVNGIKSINGTGDPSLVLVFIFISNDFHNF